MARYHELVVNPGTGQDRFNQRIALLRQIEKETGRPLVVYAANSRVPNIPNSLDHADVTPFAELTRTVPGRAIDVLLHSPGGLAEAAERIVNLLRSRFDSVRFVIPHSAFSAATMLAMSGDQLVLDDTSALGPIDPQIVYRDPSTGESIAIPTQAIMDGFRNARDAVKKDPDALGVYLPLLNKLDLSIFEICKNAEKLAKKLVRDWLRTYMFRGDPRAGQKAAKATKFLSSHRDRLSHSRPITVDTLKKQLQLRVFDLRDTPTLRNLYSELWGEIEWFVDHTDTAKMFENAHGVGFRKRFQIQQSINLQLPLFPQQPSTSPAQTPPQT